MWNVNDSTSRRGFLKGLSLGTLGFHPFVAQLAAQSAARGANHPVRTPRFVFVLRSNGLRPYGVVPEGLGRYGDVRLRNEQLLDEPLANRSLNGSMQALEPFRDRLTILQGLSSKVCAGPHGGHFGVLGAYTSGDHAPPRRETLDIVLARRFPGIFANLAFHIGHGPGDLFRYLDVSALSKNTRTPAYASPMLAYRDIFGTVMKGKGARLEAEANRNLMDFLVDDVKALRTRLGAVEREKLDHYLHGFEALREREVKLRQMGAVLGKHAPRVLNDDKFRSEIETHRLEAHFDIAAAALITGLTNVVTIRADTLEVRYQGFDHPRLKEISVHEVGHTADVEGETDRFDSDWKSGFEMRRLIRTFQMDLLGRLASKLDAVPEEDGTLLDNTLIVFLSDAGHQHHTSYANMPTVVIGNLAGKLRTGRYLHYPEYNRSGHRTLANLFMSFLHAAGAPQDRYGDPDLGLDESIDQSGPLHELMV